MDQTITETVTRVPLYIIALHRLTRLGKASIYTPTKRFVQFNITYPLSAKMVGLADADRVTLIYRPKEERR
jgi:hypothetical protein